MPQNAKTRTPEDITFCENLARLYLRYGSVDEALASEHTLPISPADYHRKIVEWGIVKAPSKSSSLTDILSFLSHYVRSSDTIANLYGRMPHTFQPSLQTVYRVLHNIKEGIVTRSAVALVVSHVDNHSLVLVGNDVSIPRADIGKHYGAISLPMGFSKQDEDPRDSIKRVMQREVFMEPTVKHVFPHEVIPDDPKPIMKLTIADVSVCVYHIVLPRRYHQELSSEVLKDLRFEAMDTIEQKEARLGVGEILNGYQKKLLAPTNKVYTIPSIINIEIAARYSEAR